MNYLLLSVSWMLQTFILLLWTCGTQTISCWGFHIWEAKSGKGLNPIFLSSWGKIILVQQKKRQPAVLCVFAVSLCYIEVCVLPCTSLQTENRQKHSVRRLMLHFIRGAETERMHKAIWDILWWILQKSLCTLKAQKFKTSGHIHDTKACLASL